MTALTPTQLAEAIERAKKWLLCRAGEGRGYHTLGAEALLHQTAKLEAAREALDSYADHREECASNGEGATEPPCDCGFDAALASLPSAPAATPTRTEAPCCECGVSMMRPNQHCKYPGNHPAGVLDETALADWLAGRAKDWGAPQLAQASAIIRALTKPASAPAKTADEAVFVALEKATQFIKDHAGVTGGWWNHPTVYKFVKEELEPVICAHREANSFADLRASGGIVGAP
jgi:hypothetical protein